MIYLPINYRFNFETYNVDLFLYNAITQKWHYARRWNKERANRHVVFTNEIVEEITNALPPPTTVRDTYKELREYVKRNNGERVRGKTVEISGLYLDDGRITRFRTNVDCTADCDLRDTRFLAAGPTGMHISRATYDYEVYRKIDDVDVNFSWEISYSSVDLTAQDCDTEGLTLVDWKHPETKRPCAFEYFEFEAAVFRDIDHITLASLMLKPTENHAIELELGTEWGGWEPWMYRLSPRNRTLTDASSVLKGNICKKHIDPELWENASRGNAVILGQILQNWMTHCLVDFSNFEL